MHTKQDKLILILLLLIPSSLLFSQNEVSSYIELGSATPVNNFNYGGAAEANLPLSPQFVLQAGLRLANRYPSGLGDIKAGVILFPSKRSKQWIISNVVDFSNYAPYPMSQLSYRLTGAWETKHFRVDLGNTFIFYMGSGVVKYHLLTPTFSFKGRIWDDSKNWNISFFLRNFNRFEVHGSKCTEWGTELSARIKKNWKVFCEPMIITAGNMNATATFYNFNCHVGGTYQW